MWGGAGGIPPPPPPTYGMAPMAAARPSTTTPNQKHDIFVGNLDFNTTEEQLHQAFSEIGRVLKVRMVNDVETGRPRGFAFVEFEDPQAALSAIRNMNDYELNGRRLRVNFSNASHLEALAGKLGMDLTQRGGASSSAGGTASTGRTSSSAGTSAVADALKGLTKGEMYDVVAKLKEIADRDPDEARRIIAGHPQLPEALLFLMSKLDMVKTPIASAAEAALPAALPQAPPTATTTVPTTTARAADPRDPRTRAADPRMAAKAAPAAPVVAPPPARVDPRQRMDPRQQQQQAQQVPPPPPPPPMRGAPPPPPPPPPRTMGGGAAHLDPTLVQQVMSLTPQQIQQLPPDKQQSILQLRQQISGGR